MKRVRVWEVCGRWYFAVYIGERIGVIGECSSRERAQSQGALA